MISRVQFGSLTPAFPYLHSPCSCHANHTISHCNAQRQRKCLSRGCKENRGAPVFFFPKPRLGWADQACGLSHAQHTLTPSHSTHDISVTMAPTDTLMRPFKRGVNCGVSTVFFFSLIHCMLKVISMLKQATLHVLSSTCGPGSSQINPSPTPGPLGVNNHLQFLCF